MSRIAFLGLGAMGSRMARRLLESGQSLTVWNRDQTKADPLRSLGAQVAATPGDAARSAEIVITMVADDAAAREVWLADETGVVAGIKPGAIAIECSTVTPKWIERLHTILLSHQVKLLDAPVAGSRPQAEAGQLVMMVGGDATALNTARPILEPLTAKILHAGLPGQGARLKLAVNALFASQLSSLAEWLGLLSQQGFSASEAATLLGEFPIVAPPLAGAAQMMAAGQFDPLLTIDLLEKDLTYAQCLAAKPEQQLPMVTAARGVVQRAQDAGLGSANVTALAAVYQQ
ncbi:MAG: NAD(P)-dependent oxidoreductase [Wenzhouxiangellaceae bacterium]